MDPRERDGKKAGARKLTTRALFGGLFCGERARLRDARRRGPRQQRPGRKTGHFYDGSTPRECVRTGNLISTGERRRDR